MWNPRLAITNSAKGRIAVIMSDGRERTNQDLMDKTGLTRPSVNMALKRLTDLGLLQREKYERYYIYRSAL